MKSRTFRLTTLFAGILVIGTISVGVIIYAIYQYVRITSLQGQFLSGQFPTATAKLNYSKIDSPPTSLIGPPFAVDKITSGFPVKIQQRTENSHWPEKESSKDYLYPLIATTIRNDFPELELSEEEIEDLSQIILKLRKSIQGFREFDPVEGSFTDFRQLEDQRDDALWDFERITGMSFVEFLNRAPSEGGIDNAESDRDKSMLESSLYSDRP